MGLIKEFKQFAVRGNVIDLAVGIIIGGAFTKIVSSLVGDVFMPILGLVTGGTSFSERTLRLGDGEDAAELKWGAFMQTVLDFMLIAACVFVLVKIINMIRASLKDEPEETQKAPPPEDIMLLREIRDALTKTTPRRVE